MTSRNHVGTSEGSDLRGPLPVPMRLTSPAPGCFFGTNQRSHAKLTERRMDKIDQKKQHKALYTARQGKPVMVDVPEFTFLMADGQGDPGERFGQLCEALYPLAYGLRGVIKKAAEPKDYTVAPLEGLWWADDMKAFAENRRKEWQWTLMIMQPPEVGHVRAGARRGPQEKEAGADR